MANSLLISSVGRRQLGVHAFLLLINIVVLAFAARVNIYQEFYFVADLFPLGLSITTLVLLLILTVSDLVFTNAFTARPYFQICFFSIFSCFWLGFNAFSTSRWRYVPMNCNSIPADYAEERTWCKDLQALKAFVWIEWLLFFLTASATLHYTLMQSNLGNKHIYNMPLSRYVPNVYSQWYNDDGGPRNPTAARDSEFLQYEKPAPVAYVL